MVRITPQELKIIETIAGAKKEFDRPGIARTAGWDPNTAYEVFNQIKHRCLSEVGRGKGVRGQTVDLFTINSEAIPACCEDCKYAAVSRFPCAIAQKIVKTTSSSEGDILEVAPEE